MDVNNISGADTERARSDTLPRHAGVLPRFATAFVHKPMLLGALAFRGPDFLAWRGPIPSPEMATELRRVFVDGRRNGFDPIWAAKVGVRLAGDWRSVLQPEEMQRMGGLLALMPSEDGLPDMTLREVKKALHMPVVDVLGLLARIEAVSWADLGWSGSQPGPNEAPSDTPRHEVGHAVTGEWRASVRAVIQQAWVKQLQVDDLRFGAPQGVARTTLSAWLWQQLEQDEVSSAGVAMGNALLEADQADWSTELRGVLNAALGEHFRHSKSRGVKLERHIGMFLMRYGGMEGHSLQQVGDAYEVSRERIRKICDEILMALRMRPVAMPALTKVMAQAEAIAPLPMDKANEQLAHLLGPGVGIAAAMDFAQAVGWDTPTQASELYSRTDSGRATIPILRADDEKEVWIQQAYTLARRDCRTVGCSSLVRVLGLLALEGVSVSRDDLLGALGVLPDFKLLDEGMGWFCLSGESSMVAARMRKLLSVTKGSVHLDTLVVTLATDDRLLTEGPIGVALPPKHILGAMLATWPWLSCSRQNRFTSDKEFTIEEQLSPMEVRALEVLSRFDGVATRTDLLEVLVHEEGFSNPALSNLLTTSPVLSKVEHSIYRHNGQVLSIQGLAQARTRRSQQSSLPGASRQNVDPSLVDMTRPFCLRLSQTTSEQPGRRRTIHLPQAYAKVVEGEFRHARGLWPLIDARRGVLFLGLADAAELAGIAPGEAFDLWLDLPNCTYDVGETGAALMQAPQSERDA